MNRLAVLTAIILQWLFFRVSAQTRQFAVYGTALPFQGEFFYGIGRADKNGVEYAGPDVNSRENVFFTAKLHTDVTGAKVPATYGKHSQDDSGTARTGDTATYARTVLTNLGPGINGPYDDYDPMISADGQSIIFTSVRPGSKHLSEDIFISRIRDGRWDKAERLPKGINSRWNDGSPFISYDGRILLFSSCGRRGGLGGCDIYISKRTSRGWSKPENLGPDVNSKYWDAHPSLSPDGKQLYFSSTRPGGKGGKDIWMAEMKDGKWQEPRPIEEINTPWDEVSPFIHFDSSTLYFSSDRPSSAGRLDFYVSRLEPDGQWSRPQNLGPGINTQGEEYSLRVDRSGRRGFFAGNMHGGGYGGLDIYSFYLPEASQAGEMAYLKGRVKDMAGNTIEYSELHIFDFATGVPLEQLDFKLGCFSAMPSPGKRYGIMAFAEGYAPHSSHFTFPEGTEGYVNRDITMMPLDESSVVVIRLENVLFATDSYLLPAESMAEIKRLAYFLKAHPDMRAEISGHTDDTGTQRHNLTLSENRALAVCQALLEAGVEPSRLSAKGYGSSVPAATNGTEEGRRENRRTEMKISFDKPGRNRNTNL